MRTVKVHDNYLSLRLPSDTLARLKDYCWDTRQKPATFVRELVEKHLAEHTNDAAS